MSLAYYANKMEAYMVLSHIWYLHLKDPIIPKNIGSNVANQTKQTTM